MTKYIIAVSLIAFTGCDSVAQRRERERQAREHERQSRIDSALRPLSGALNFESVQWGGPLTMSRQEYLRNHPNQVFYTETDNIDLAYSGDMLTLSFVGAFGEAFFTLTCSRSQLSSLAHTTSNDAFGNYCIIFSIGFDNMKQVRLSRERWNPLFLDFATRFGFTHRRGQILREIPGG